MPGIFRKGITEADASMAFETLRNSAFSAFLVGQQAARLMRENKPDANGTKGTIIFTNASAALKGFPSSGAFAMACQAKSGLAQSMARELMPQGIHVANVPIDAAIGWTQEDGTRAGIGRPRVEIAGRGFGPEVLDLLRTRPEVEAVEVVEGGSTLEITLHPQADVAALVALIVSQGGAVEEVRRGNLGIEEAFLALVSEAS